MSDVPPPGRGTQHSILGALLGWGLLLLLLAYAAFVHHGLGPPKLGVAQWYEPRGFLFDIDATASLLEVPRQAFVGFGLPALLGVLAVSLATRSAVARALALASFVAVLLFVFYGAVAPFPWRFFGWRGSATLVLTALVVGFAAAAPFLAASWLRLAWPWRVAVYLPFAFTVVAFLRNATGTDPNLSFAISPWPAISVFGLEVGGLFIAIGLLGTGLGVAGLARARSPGHGAGSALAGVALGLAAPMLVLLAGGALHIFPFGLGAGTLVAVAVAVALCITAVGLVRPGSGPEALARRARHIAVGAALLGVPLLAGQAWAYLDYYVTREIRAQTILDALAAYNERETLYPDTLEELVEAGDLEAIPEPDIGFDVFYDGEFRYQNFGTSFLIEFPAPRWVQCAYTPPYEYEDDEEEEEFYDDEDLTDEDGEPWSCPSRPPELW